MCDFCRRIAMILQMVPGTMAILRPDRGGFAPAAAGDCAVTMPWRMQSDGYAGGQRALRDEFAARLEQADPE
jgi:hypothetical protein